MLFIQSFKLKRNAEDLHPGHSVQDIKQYDNDGGMCGDDGPSGAVNAFCLYPAALRALKVGPENKADVR